MHQAHRRRRRRRGLIAVGAAALGAVVTVPSPVAGQTPDQRSTADLVFESTVAIIPAVRVRDGRITAAAS